MNDEDDAILDDLDEDENADKRHTKRRFDQMVEKDGELSDSEDEDVAEAHGVRRQPGTIKRKNRVDYRNLTEFGGDSGVDSGAATPAAGSSLPDNDVDVEDDINVRDAPATNGEASGAATDANVSAVASGAQSPAPATDTNGDVPMEDQTDEPVPSPPNAPVLQEKTPPDSPAPPAPEVEEPAHTAAATEPVTQPDPAVKEEATAEEAAVEARGEGAAEREGENVNAEAAAEEAMEAEGTK